MIEELCDPAIVLKPAGLLPKSREMHGHAGDRVVVPVRLGGRARHTGIELDFRFVHVCTVHEGKLARLDMYLSKSDALEAVGLQGEP